MNMRTIKFYQVDAFTDKAFGGNPAGVCPLIRPLSDTLQLQIANENNLSETAFLLESEREDADYDIRWFTPTHEVDLCGHATLASAYIVFNRMAPNCDKLTFHSLSGLLHIRKMPGNRLEMDFPLWPLTLKNADNYDFGFKAQEVYESEDMLCVLKDEISVRDLIPDMNKLASESPRCVIVTAPSDDTDYDFVSRVFCPAVGVPEDPVTGSAHCVLSPYWADKLGKTEMRARQISKRGGDLSCRLSEERVFISGKAALYLEGNILIEEE